MKHPLSLLLLPPALPRRCAVNLFVPCGFAAHKLLPSSGCTHGASTDSVITGLVHNYSLTIVARNKKKTHEAAVSERDKLIVFQPLSPSICQTRLREETKVQRALCLHLLTSLKQTVEHIWK